MGLMTRERLLFLLCIPSFTTCFFSPCPVPRGYGSRGQGPCMELRALSAAQEVVEASTKSGTKAAAPLSDRFEVLGFHSIELYCGDASNTARRFMVGLGMPLVARSDMSTGNTLHASHVVQSNDLCFVFTAPYGVAAADDPASQGDDGASKSMPGFDASVAHDFFRGHGLGVRAIGLRVKCAETAFRRFIGSGGVGVLDPTEVVDADGRGSVVVSEVAAYGDVVLRFISYGGGQQEGQAYAGPFLPNFQAVKSTAFQDYGLQRLDHAVGNVWDMAETVEYLSKAAGFHEFAEFTAEDVGTVDSGLNSIVLATNDEMVLLPINEPTYGTPRKSQIQTYLEQNRGPGVQHLALKTDDIFTTMRLMQAASGIGGMEFMEGPDASYYRDLPRRIPSLTKDQLAQIQEYGLLADEDDQGILLQIFTKPVGDRATFFLEIIQRIGCMVTKEDGTLQQKGGCGGFGKGNFKALFKSIEDYEKTLGVK